MNKKYKSRIKNVGQGLILLLLTILLAIVLRVFFMAAFTISGISMYPTVDTGDKVVVNKQIPGPRIIRYGNPEEGIKPDIRRIKGLRRIRRNDVLLLNKPYNRTESFAPDWNVHYIKRCVAIPGDTFYIEQGIYKVKNSPDTIGNYHNQYLFSLEDEASIPKGIFRCYPKRNPHYQWTAKSFGPLYVPRKNDTLAIDSINIALYQDMIEYETGGNIQISDHQVYLNGRILTHYTFGMNYYFVAGDYVSNSVDSRYWGPLPEDHIVGKAAFVLSSRDKYTGKMRWNRFLKAVR